MKKLLALVIASLCLCHMVSAQHLLSGTPYGSMAGKGDGWGDSQPLTAFNGNTNMGNQVDYNSNNEADIPWIALELNTPTKITKVRVLPRQEYSVDASGDTTWSTWMYQYLEGAKFQASNDSLFQNAVDLATISQVTNSYWQEFTVSNPNKYKYVRLLNVKTFITFTQLEFYGETNAAAGKTVYIPAEWKNANNNIAWDSVNRMKQSANCVVFWGPLAGNDPTVASNKALRFNPSIILDSMEAVYKFFMDSMRIIPDSGQWSKYKLIIVMNNTWRDGLFTGWAYGGAYENQAPAMWVDPGVFKENAWTVTHEFTHSIQNMIQVMYPGHGFTNTNSGFFWETHANFMAMQRYRSFATATDLPRAINMSSYFIGSGRKHYAQFYFLQQFVDDYGMDFVSRIWKETNASIAETPLATAKRLLGMDQHSFNNYMMKYAVNSVKWDFSTKSYMQAAEASLERMWKYRKTIVLDSISDGHYAVPNSQAPQQYGYNIVRLYPQTEDSCGIPYVYLKFVGHKDANASSGWRYAFVTVDSITSNTHFSDFYDKDSTEIIYKLPNNTSETYLVVMGAPTEMHFQNANIFEPGFTKLFRYPWEIKIQGAIPEGYQTGFRKEDKVGLAGAPHANGGGWVASTASVDASVYVGPHAIVTDRAKVTGNVRIEGKAEIRDDASVSGNAVVKDFAVVGGNSNVSGATTIAKSANVYYSTISENATVTENAYLAWNTILGNAQVYGNAFSTGSTGLGGSIKIGGDAEIFGNCTQGTYLQCIGITDGQNTRTECDGLNDSPLNVDVNASYSNYTETNMHFAKVVACGDSVGLSSSAPIITLDSVKTIQLPVNSLEIQGRASDIDGEIVSYRWRLVSAPDNYVFAGTTNSLLELTGLSAGTYVFSFTATDNSGMSGSKNVVVQVLAENQLPTVSAGTDVTITLPTNYVTLNGTVSDVDGYIDSIKWYAVTGADAYIVSPGSLTTYVQNLKEGSYKFALRAVDNSFGVAEDTVLVTVLPVSNTLTTSTTKLTALPNPTTGQVHLSFPIVTGGRIQVYDTKGRTVFTKQLAAGNETADINLSSLSAGLYYIKVSSNNGKAYKVTISVIH